MQTLTFEQLRINLTLTFDSLVEPIQIVKKGKIQGYIVKELPGEPVKNEPDNAKKQPCQSMPEPEKVPVSASCEVKKSIDTSDIAIDTIYEPDPVRPVKQAKQSSKAAPVVSAMLSGISRRVTVAHHPCCTCPICKPVIPKA